MLTPLPPAPDPNDPTTFAAKADALVTALANMVSEINTLGSTPVGVTPCFSASPSAVLGLTSGAAFAKLPCDSEFYDVSGQYDAVTNKRFTCSIAGKYRFSAQVGFSSTTTLTAISIAIFKNGTQFTQTQVAPASNTVGSAGISVDMALSSGDFVELFVGCAGTGTLQAKAAAGGTFFSGSFIST